MALRTPLTVSPHMYIGDVTGRPLDYGMVYFGEPDKDPEFYPINVFSDDELTIPITQPIRTKGGYLNDNKGDMAEIHAEELIYSVKVLDQYGRKIFYKGQSMRSTWNDDVIIRIDQAIAESKDIAADLAASALIDIGAQATNVVNAAIDNTAVPGGVLADTFVTATANGAGSIARTQRSKNLERVSVKDFGAKGDGDQSLLATNYITDNKSANTVITQQTPDGIAINKAIVYLRSIGGGALYFPAGTYSVFAYLERLDFPIVIYGDGASTVIKSCDNSPTDKSGYGVFHMEPDSISSITIANIKVDGNAHVRTMPTSEHRSYNIHAMGQVRLHLFNVISINAAIDCFATRYARPDSMAGYDGLYCKVVDCFFEDSFRNTVSCVSGNNTTFVNCDILGGGYVHGGTNPRFALDVEPTSGNPDSHVRNLRFEGCRFARAINAVIGGTWGQATFRGCTVDASHKHASNIGKIGYPWAITMSSIGDWTFDGCTIFGSPVDKSTNCVHYNAYDEISDFSENGWLRLNNTTFENCGFTGNGRRFSATNVVFKNSLLPITFKQGSNVPQSDITIRNMELVNVFENGGATATESSFSIANTTVGNFDIDGLKISIDSKLLAKRFVAADFTKPRYYGLFWGSAFTGAVAAGRLAKAENVYISGYYKKLNTTLVLTTISRDWGSPSTPPIDTALSSAITAQLANGTVTNGVVANLSVTGTATYTDTVANHTLGGRTTPYYRNCKMWGDYA